MAAVAERGRARLPPTAPRTGAVVTGASYRALAVVRSLGRHGVPVRVVRTDDHAIAGRSRYAERPITVPAADEGERVECLLELAGREGLAGWVLIPTHDEEAALIARHHGRLQTAYRLTTPPWEALRDAYDKRRTHALAQRIGIAQPWTAFPDSEEDLESAGGRFPVILKPAHKASVNRLTIDKAWRADDAAALRRRYREACEIADPRILMVQELVPGDGASQLSFAALCSDGDVLAGLTARRTRQYPMDFGRASTYVETVVDPSVERDARALLAEMRWTGLVEVEFKRDARSGANKLLDINPRAWGWQSLCGRAGVDFPMLAWRLAVGAPIERVRPATGVRWMRMATDMPAAASEIRARNLSVRSYLSSFRGPLEFAVFARDDPVPALVGPLTTARLLASRLRGGRPI